MSVKLRFAPSPTGRLHVGNARTAAITWLYARANQGQFMLRIDDTDLERSKDEYTQDLKDGLQWLGVNWDDYAHQRDRMARYDEVITVLKESGRLYPCYETPEELGLKRKSQLSRGKPPIYDRAALDLTDADRAALEAKGLRPHWRFKLNHEAIEWDDLVRGPQKFDGKDFSDPVLIREDGRPLYHICSVIDDIDFNITHIIRGEDHVTNSAAHKQMFEALGATAPVLAHLPLIADMEGGKLSKRLGSLSLGELRDVEVLEPMAIMSYLARLGSSDPIDVFSDVQDIIASFDIGKFSRSTPKFDPNELVRLNAKLIHDMDFASAKSRLPAGMDAPFWDAIKANLERVSEAQQWWDMVHKPITPVIEDADFIAQALTLLPAGPWNQTTWQTWTKAIQGETGRKGKQLFMPLRQAITGMDHGPDLGTLLPLIGEDRVRQRLSVKQAA